MSEYSSIILFWSKGAPQRRIILCEIDNAQKLDEPIFVSRIAEKFRNEDKSPESLLNISRSAIRKHVKILIEYGLIKPINKGGKPEYLEITEEGKKVVQKLRKK